MHSQSSIACAVIFIVFSSLLEGVNCAAGGADEGRFIPRGIIGIGVFDDVPLLIAGFETAAINGGAAGAELNIVYFSLARCHYSISIA